MTFIECPFLYAMTINVPYRPQCSGGPIAIFFIIVNSFKLFFNQGGRAVRDMLPDAASISSLLESRLLTSNFPVQ